MCLSLYCDLTKQDKYSIIEIVFKERNVYPMGMTLTEKILRAHLVDGEYVKGEEIGIKIDQTLTQDATGTMAYLEFEAIGIPRVKTERSVAYIDVEKLGINLCADIDVAASLCVRSLQEADRFTPLGMRGSMLVSNYLTNRHRSRIDKFEALVVLAGEKIAWLVGETIDTRAAVDSESTRIIKLRIE